MSNESEKGRAAGRQRAIMTLNVARMYPLPILTAAEENADRAWEERMMREVLREQRLRAEEPLGMMPGLRAERPPATRPPDATASTRAPPAHPTRSSPPDH